MKASHSAAGFAAVLIMLGSSSVQAEVLIGAGAPLTGQMAWHGEDAGARDPDGDIRDQRGRRLSR